MVVHPSIPGSAAVEDSHDAAVHKVCFHKYDCLGYPDSYDERGDFDYYENLGKADS